MSMCSKWTIARQTTNVEDATTEREREREKESKWMQCIAGCRQPPKTKWYANIFVVAYPGCRLRLCHFLFTSSLAIPFCLLVNVQYSDSVDLFSSLSLSFESSGGHTHTYSHMCAKINVHSLVQIYWIARKIAVKCRRQQRQFPFAAWPSITEHFCAISRMCELWIQNLKKTKNKIYMNVNCDKEIDHSLFHIYIFCSLIRMQFCIFLPFGMRDTEMRTNTRALHTALLILLLLLRPRWTEEKDKCHNFSIMQMYAVCAVCAESAGVKTVCMCAI